MDPSEVCFLLSGSQGEPGSAMTRMAMLEMRRLTAGPGDAVIFSSRVIPGNDKAIGEVIDDLGRIHISGEDWLTRSDQALNPGDKVEVTSVDGLTLDVRKTIE